MDIFSITPKINTTNEKVPITLIPFVFPSNVSPIVNNIKGTHITLTIHKPFNSISDLFGKIIRTKEVIITDKIPTVAALNMLELGSPLKDDTTNVKIRIVENIKGKLKNKNVVIFIIMALSKLSTLLK